MMGIYKITNKINNKCYIGFSIDIKNRWKEHKNFAKYNKRCKNKPLYLAFNKYGLDNFIFEILEECKESELADREIFYINKFHSNNKKFGYNITSGGETGPSLKGEKNPKAVCKDEHIKFIRECFQNGVYKKNAYDEYVKKYGYINKNTFNSIWFGKSYKYIMPEVFTKENIKKQAEISMSYRPKSLGPRDTSKYVLDIRVDKLNGMRYSDACKKYEFININTFKDIWINKTFKQIQPL